VTRVVDEVLIWCVVDADSELVFLWYLDSLTVAKSVEICRPLFWVADGFQVCWDLQVSLYLVDQFRVGVGCLEAVCDLTA
jgi:hypothetical protein